MSDVNNTDQWRVSPTFPGLRVNDRGEVQTRYVMAGRGAGGGKGVRVLKLSSEWRPIKVLQLPSGYRYVHVSEYGPNVRRRRRIVYVHQLVTECFIGPCPEGQQVRHDNGNRADNRRTNLLYGTPVQNAADQLRHGTRPIGSRHGIAKLTEGKVTIVHSLLAAGESAEDIARRFKVCIGTINNIRAGRTWRHVLPVNSPC